MLRSSSMLLALLGACAPFVQDRPAAAGVEAADRAAAAPLRVAPKGAFLRPAFDDARGRVLLRLPPPDARGIHAECLHLVGIETGLGANDVGLDRGQLGGTRLVRFRRIGGRVALEEVNLKFRGEAGSEDERAAVEESFANSILFAAEPAEEHADGAVDLDVTPLLVRDLHGLAEGLADAGQGRYVVDAERSAALPRRCAAFPRNVDLAAVLTLASDAPGRLARATAADGGALTFVQRQAFIALPDDEYRARPFHVRMGAFAIAYDDPTVPLAVSTARRFAVRHRLRAGEPLVYYVDRAAPEPVRSALVEGASWWADAFAAAGYPGVYRVEVAPEGLDPLDVRHNVIQWVHRSTRGWSYGNAVTDPRTGEILKGHVSLGSLRVRQDRLLFEGLLGAGATGSGAPDDPIELSLARIRQLAAHEVGHTLGLAHNFAASVNARASVMDYPAPRVVLDADGDLDVSDAYAVGVGAWDVHAIRMLYEEPGEDEGVAALQARLAAEADAAGLLYLTDRDARPAGAAHPLANLWDDGADPVTALAEALDVRAVALRRFGPENLAADRPLSELHEVFVPLYLHHRYQVEAAVKCIGGVLYHHAFGGESAAGAEPVPTSDQRRAFDVLARTLDADVLRIAPGVAALFLPAPPGAGATRERFEGRAGDAFDVHAAADVAARMTLASLLHPERLERVHLQSVAAASAFGSLAGYLRAVARAAGFPEGPPEERDADAEVADVVRLAALDELLASYFAGEASPAVREALRGELERLVPRAEAAGLVDAARRVRAALERGVAPAPAPPVGAVPGTPPGSPIGAAPFWPPAGLHSGWPSGLHSGWPSGLHSGWPSGLHSGWPGGLHSGWPGGLHSGWPGRPHSGWQSDCACGAGGPAAARPPGLYPR